MQYKRALLKGQKWHKVIIKNVYDKHYIFSIKELLSNYEYDTYMYQNGNNWVGIMFKEKSDAVKFLLIDESYDKSYRGYKNWFDEEKKRIHLRFRYVNGQVSIPNMDKYGEGKI